MRFFIAAVAMATTAFAQTADFNPIYTPLKDEVLPAGSTYEITWEAPEAYASESVKISLIGGADDASLVPVADIASGIANSDNSYSWTIDAALGDVATYGIVIALESDPAVFQYSNPFSIEAGEAAPSGSVSAGVTITTAEGVATVTLTSCPPTTTSAAPNTTSAAPNTTVSTSSISTPTWNTTTLVTLPPPATTTPAPAPTPEPTEPAPAPEPTPTDVPAGAARYVSGPLALVGGLAMFMLL